MTIQKYDMKCIYETAKMCFVTIAQHNWLGQKVLLFKSSFRIVANYKMPDFYKGMSHTLCIFQVVAPFIRDTFP